MSVCAHTHIHIHWSRDEDVTYDCRNIWIHMFCALAFVFFFNSSIPSFIHSFIHSFLFLDDVVAAYGIFAGRSFSPSIFPWHPFFVVIVDVVVFFVHFFTSIFTCIYIYFCVLSYLDIISDSNGSMRASFFLPFALYFAPVRSHFQRIMRDCHLCILLLLLYMYMVFCHKCILKSS